MNIGWIKQVTNPRPSGEPYWCLSIYGNAPNYLIISPTISVEGLKYTFNSTSWRSRPNGEDQSFPSGHASVACSGAAFIGQRYGWRYGSLAMIPAAYVGWARVDAGLHHSRDVVAGCALGITSGLIFTQPLPGNTTVTPFLDKKVWGLQIQSVW